MSRARWWHPSAASGRRAHVEPGGGSARVVVAGVRVRPTSLAAPAAVVVALVLWLAAGPVMFATRPTGAAATSVAPPSVTVRPAAQTPGVRRAEGRAWLARGAGGSWILGRPGETTRLAPTEIGLAVANGWLVSADARSFGRAIGWRRTDGGPTRTSRVGVVPASVAVAGSKAYVSGFDRVTAGDPGVFVVGLADGTVAEVIERTAGSHPRSVAVSPDQSRVVSATCDELARCALTMLSPDTDRQIQVIEAPGYLRTTTASVAIVGSDPAAWIAGIDLATGRELWRRTALEMWSGYATTDEHLVQAELRPTASGPVFAVEVIDARTGTARTVFSTSVGHGIGLWPELSTDDRLAIGPAYSLEDGLAKAAGASLTVRMFSVADGQAVGSEQVEGGR